MRTSVAMQAVHVAPDALVGREFVPGGSYQIIHLIHTFLY